MEARSGCDGTARGCHPDSRSRAEVMKRPEGLRVRPPRRQWFAPASGHFSREQHSSSVASSLEAFDAMERRMRRWFGLGVVAPMLLIACATRPPVPPLGHVSASHAIRVRFRSEPRAISIDFRAQGHPSAQVERLFADAQETIEQFNRVFVDTLRRAGYEVTENGPSDVHVVRQLYFDTEPRQARHGSFSVDANDIVRVVLHVNDTEGNTIDRFDFHATEGTVCVVVDLVNAMLQSRKVASYAETRRKLGAVDNPSSTSQ